VACTTNAIFNHQRRRGIETRYSNSQSKAGYELRGTIGEVSALCLGHSGTRQVNTNILAMDRRKIDRHRAELSWQYTFEGHIIEVILAG
jgi:hypothetical protein